MEDAERIALSIGILARDLEVRYNKRVILMQTPDHVSRTLLPDTVLNTYLNDITEWLADGWEHSIARLRSSRPSARNSPRRPAGFGRPRIDASRRPLAEWILGSHCVSRRFF